MTALYIIKPHGKPLYKIGISRSIKRRKATIERTTDQDFTVLFHFAFWRSARLERWLHGFFAPYRTTFIGSGKTEYFRLPMWWICTLLVGLWLLRAVQYFVVALLVGLVVIGGYYVGFNF